MQKTAFILADRELDPGFDQLKLHTLQVLRGNLQHWSYVIPAVKPELGVVNRMLGLGVEGDLYLCPRESSSSAALAYEDLEETVELLRLLVAIPKRWESDFTNAFGGMLRPEEPFPLPAYRGKIVWVGLDATPGVFGATDFTNAVYSREETTQFW